MFVCKFCKNEYSTSSVLSYHQKTTGFCLKIQNSLNKEEENKTIITNNNSLVKCEYCNKDFSNKFKLSSHLNICKEKELKNIKKEFELKLEEVKKESKKELEEVKKEYQTKIDSINKERKKEIELKDDYIQTLKNQLNIYIEKSTLNNNSVNTTNNNNIINTINIKEEEFTKLFSLIKPMLTENINKSMEKINYQQMVDVVEELDEFFVNEFVKNFKDYLFTKDSSRGIVVIKLENGESSKVTSVQFVLDCLKIGEKELKKLFKAVEHYLFSLHEDEKMSDYDYALNIKKLKELYYFVFNKKSNKIVKKIASELVKNSSKLSTQKSTDNKVLEDEILKLH